ncbi:hypothetical protein A9X05_07610 [Mycobacterium sp. E3298]|uniref:tetratricopeptide repeat protein n=2 Tax=Mycobacterium TaxID=1763 RepID=UPI000800E01F|nr:MULTISPECIES: tetratricopeptide repeat protein [unclassified Mycobacterium]OBG67154.1 hypothetical protein A5703_12720 [Mycobacterium sp. E188]OBG70060.1 hypothetical protein A5701_03795 [Mycobacterium sp. E3305]OBG95080.1 hypothetical protein A9X05_07610 [Mycobacterium sp. E3298]OBH43331.1 hypothetical protein A5691_17365 [Mycobacterium sp. E183]
MSENLEAVDPVTAAVQKWQSVHAALGPQHESTLAARLALAEARQNAGDTLGAVGDAGAVLDTRREVLGSEHPDTLAVAGAVARWRFLLGDIGAVDQLRELIPAMVGVLGAEHPDTLRASHVVAYVEYPHEDAATRLVRWVRLCGAETRVFGVEHEVTLSAAYMVAQARYDLGDPFGASSDAVPVVTYRRQLLGAHHPETLAAQLARLGWLGEATGPTSFVLKSLNELITTAENALGHDDEITLRARYVRALLTPKTSGTEVDCISEWDLLAEDLTRGLGEAHPLSVGAREQRSAAYAEWEQDLNEVRDLAFHLFVDVESEERDIDQPPGRDWLDTGDLDEDAVEKVTEDADDQRAERAALMENVVAAKKALSRSARAAGNDAYETLLWRYFLAWRFWEGHEFEAAGERTRRLIDDCARLLGDDHELTEASRTMLHFIDTRTWSGLPLFWDGSAMV